MAVRTAVIIIIAIMLNAVCGDSQCAVLTQDDLSSDDSSRTLKFSFANNCKNVQDFQIKFLRVEAKSSTSSSVLCNIMFHNGGCVGNTQTCVCNSPTKFAVTRRISDEEETWEVTANFQGKQGKQQPPATLAVTVPGLEKSQVVTETPRTTQALRLTTRTTTTTRRTSSRQVSVRPKSGVLAETRDTTHAQNTQIGQSSEVDPVGGPGNRISEQSTDGDSNSGTHTASSLGFGLLGAVLGLIAIITVVLVIICRLKGHTPISAVRRALRQSQAYEEAVVVRRPVPSASSQTTSTQVNRESMPGSEPYYSDIRDLQVSLGRPVNATNAAAYIDMDPLGVASQKPAPAKRSGLRRKPTAPLPMPPVNEGAEKAQKAEKAEVEKAEGGAKAEKVEGEKAAKAADDEHTTDQYQNE